MKPKKDKEKEEMHDLLSRSVNVYRELYLENQELKRQLGVI